MLADLREQHRRTQLANAQALANLYAAVRAAGSARVDGRPISRTKIIEAAGLSRRTAYKLFGPLPDH